MKTLLFDFDGTLVDSERTYFESWKYVFESCGVPLSISLWITEIWTYPPKKTPLEYLESLKLPNFNSEDVRRIRRLKEEELAGQIPLRKGILEILRESSALNVNLGIVSGADRKWVVGHISRLAISDYFQHVICREDTVLHKPDPEPYLEILRRFGCQAEDAVVLEDTPIGIKAAKAAGCRCIAFQNSITQHLDLSMADCVCPAVTMADIQAFWK